MTAVYLTTEQVGEQIGHTADWVRRRCVSGQIAASKVGEWRITQAAVDQFMRPTNVKKAASASSKMSARQKRRAS